VLACRNQSLSGAGARAGGGRHLSWRNEGLERLGFLEELKERRFRVREREFGECFSGEHNRRESECTGAKEPPKLMAPTHACLGLYADSRLSTTEITT